MSEGRMARVQVSLEAPDMEALRVRATAKGQTLSGYIRELVIRDVRAEERDGKVTGGGGRHDGC